MKGYQNVNKVEELPITLKAEDIQAYLGLSRSATYQLLNSKGFPSMTVGRRKMVPREHFINWVNSRVTDDAPWII